MAKKEWIPIADVAQQRGCSVDEVREWCKQKLTYRKDYINMPNGNGLHIAKGSLGKNDPDPLYTASDDEIIIAKVHRTMPPNKRFIWITAPGIEGKGICNIPRKFVSRFRDAGKHVRVRHVEDNVYQLVDV